MSVSMAPLGHFGLLTLLTAALLGLSLRPAPLPAFPAAKHTLCESRPLALEQELYPRSTQATPDGILLTLPAILTATSCEAGTWNIQGVSAGKGHVPPVLNVGFNGQSLQNLVVTGRQYLKIPVDNGGQLSLSFLNQAYSVRLRDVNILQVLLRDSDCKEVNGSVDVSSGTWQSQAASGHVFGDDPLTLQTCGAKAAVLRLQGNVFQGVAPQLRIQVGSAPVQTVEISGLHTVTVPLGGATELTLQLLNPAARTEQNSRLAVQAHFVPN